MKENKILLIMLFLMILFSLVVSVKYREAKEEIWQLQEQLLKTNEFITIE